MPKKSTRRKKSRYTTKRWGRGMYKSKYVRFRTLKFKGTHQFKRTYNLIGTSGFTIGAGSMNNESIARSSATNDALVFGTGAVGTSNITYATMNLNIQLADLPDYTEFTNLFDQYKICAVRFTVRNTMNQAVGNATVGGSVANPTVGGLIMSIVDYDDSAGVTANQTGAQFMREYENYRCTSLVQPKGVIVKRYFKPRIAVGAYGGGVFTSYANQKSWLDTVSNTVQHYGVKCLMEVQSPDSSVVNNIWLYPEATVYIKCRNVK